MYLSYNDLCVGASKFMSTETNQRQGHSFDQSDRHWKGS